MEKDHNVLQILLAKLTAVKADVISFKELLNIFEEYGFSILMVIFILPLSIPAPYPPGLTTMLVVPNFIMIVQILLGYKKPHFPKWLERKEIKVALLITIINKAANYLSKFENLFKLNSRIANNQITELNYAQKVVSLISFLLVISIAIPLPLTNLLPALGILVMYYGLIKKNWLIIGTGILIGLIGLILTFFIISTGYSLLVK